MPHSAEEFARAMIEAGLSSPDEVREIWASFPSDARPSDGASLSHILVERQQLTPLQAAELLSGTGIPLVLGDYVLLAKIGSGGMGQVFKAHHRRRMLIIWDGARPHRSQLVREYVDSTEGDIVIERLPAYAPELNPVEYLWAWLKRHALANFCPDTLDQLHQGARSKLKSAQRRSSIIAACWSQANLF